MNFGIESNEIKKIIDDELDRNPEYKYLEPENEDLMNFVFDIVQKVILRNNSSIKEYIDRKIGNGI